MNERIKELSKQAWEWAEQQEYNDPAQEFSDILEQKFAELIVGECINTLEFHGFDDAVPYIKWMATNKLGVKE